MSESPQTGLWIVKTCDGNRRKKVRELAVQGIEKDASELDEDESFECNSQGAEAVQEIIEVARDEAVGLMALWVWSTKNWGRSEAQQKAVFRVMEAYLRKLKEDWMHRPENSDVRLVHMGHKDRLWEKAPAMMQELEEVLDQTRDRTGMVIALLMDYDGPDEVRRAHNLWKENGDMDAPLEDFYDLPRQGIPYRELDLRIRTGDGDSDIKHTNAVMTAYAGMETRDVFPPVLLAEYAPDMFRQHLKELREGRRKQGK